MRPARAGACCISFQAGAPGGSSGICGRHSRILSVSATRGGASFCGAVDFGGAQVDTRHPMRFSRLVAPSVLVGVCLLTTGCGGSGFHSVGTPGCSAGGLHWEISTTGNTSIDDDQPFFSKVVVVTPRDVWALGEIRVGDPDDYQTNPVGYHWDGKSWQ